MNYKESGVDYDPLDSFKRFAQKLALQTADNLSRFGMREIEVSRGESAYVWEEEDTYKAAVIEGLGTKNLVADAVRQYTGKTHYDALAQDTVAMIVNDLLTVGADPQTISMYVAVGSSDWFNDRQRVSDLLHGWAHACQLAGAVWAGGETPTLKGVIEPNAVDLSGSATGVIKPKERLTLGDKLSPGDHIVIVKSSGIHANGLTLVRKLAAERLPDGYQTPLPSGRTLGEAILTPTHIYAPLQRALFEQGINIHYIVNVTGHGWRKIMRANKEFTYRMHTVPQPQEEFMFVQQAAGLSDKEMYETYNMGAGFVYMVSADDASHVCMIAGEQGYTSWDAGVLEDGRKQVIIEPIDVTYGADSLNIR